MPNIEQNPYRRSHRWSRTTGRLRPHKADTPGEHLLNRNRVTLATEEPRPAELEAIVKQKPNKRIIGMRFYLSMYNLPNPEHIAQKKARKDARTDREERIAYSAWQEATTLQDHHGQMASQYRR